MWYVCILQLRNRFQGLFPQLQWALFKHLPCSECRESYEIGNWLWVPISLHSLRLEITCHSVAPWKASFLIVSLRRVTAGEDIVLFLFFFLSNCAYVVCGICMWCSHAMAFMWRLEDHKNITHSERLRGSWARNSTQKACVGRWQFKGDLSNEREDSHWHRGHKGPSPSPSELV